MFPAVAPVIADPSRHSAIIRYLLELDNAYNALDPNCKFRMFLYNLCPPGTATDLMNKERITASLALPSGKGGCREEDWIMAQRNNPDPENFYPCPHHFFQGLWPRVLKQKEYIDQYHVQLEAIEKKRNALSQIDEENTDQYHKLQVEQTMIERRWLAVTSKIETLRQLGIPLGEEKEAILDVANQLLANLKGPGNLISTVNDLEPLIEQEADRLAAKTAERQRMAQQASRNNAKGTSSSSGGLLTSGAAASLLDPTTLKDWYVFLDRMQDGIEQMKRFVDTDLRDVQAAKNFLKQNIA